MLSIDFRQGLSEKASIKEVRRWRESEITHGRVAMLAALGFIVGEQLSDFPLFFNFDGRVSGELATPTLTKAESLVSAGNCPI